MVTKNQKLDSYVICYHNLNEPAQYDMRVSVPRVTVLKAVNAFALFGITVVEAQK